MRSLLATRKNEKQAATVPQTIIQRELIPWEYTNPGPPTKPKPERVLEKSANAVTTMPSSRPAMKKSIDDLVRRSAQIPTPIHITKYPSRITRTIELR